MSSIKNKMTLATSILMAITLSVAAFFSLIYFENQMKMMISSQQMNMVSAIADQVDDKLHSAQAELVAVASTITPDILSDPLKVERFIASRPDTLHMFDNGLFIFSADGKLIGGMPQDPRMQERNHSDRAFFKNTMASGKPQISEPFLSAQAHHRPLIAISVPIFDEKRKISAIMAGGIDLMQDNFLGSLAKVRLGKNGYLYLFNTSRLLIVHPDQARIFKRDLPPGVNSLFDRAIEGFEGTGETVTSKGMHALSSFKRLKSTDWILAANFPESEAYAPVHRAQRILSIALAAALTVSILIIWFFMKHLTSPLLSFIVQIKELTGRKNMHTSPVLIETSDEISTLAEAFNVLLSELDLQKKELQKQLGFSQALIDTIPNPVFYKDVEGRYLGCNKAFQSFTGLTKEELLGKSVVDIADPERSREYREADNELFERQGVQVYETSVPYADGTLHDVISFKATFSGDDGSVGGLIGTMVDISERKRAESELAAQKEFAESLVQNSTAPTFVLDSRHRVIIWNRACEKLTGIKSAEVVGTDEHWKVFYDHKRPVLADLAIDGDQARIPEFYNSCSKSEIIPEGVQAERWVTYPDGRTRYVVANAAPIRNSSGDLVAVIQTLEDITDRKNKEEELNKLSQAIEQSPVSVMIADVQGTIEYVNRQFTELTGYGAEEVVGKGSQVFGFYHESWETITAGLQWRGERVNTKKSGERYWDSVRISPLRNNDGMITHFMSLNIDITERKKVEESVKDSEDKLRAITDTATDAIILVDNLGDVVYWNLAAEKVFGYSREEMIGKGMDVIVPHKYRSEHCSGFKRFMATGEGRLLGRTHALSALRRDGTEFPVELSLSGIQLKGKWHAAGIIRDVTERKSLEHQLHHVQKMEALGTFAGGIAHDFNNILTTITAYCALIEKKADDGSAIHPYLKKLLASTERGSALTRGLLAYSRKQPLDPQPVELNVMISNAAHLLSRLLGEDVELAVLPAAEPLMVLADSLQIEQVLMNLASNARDAMPGGGILQLGTDRLELGADFIKKHGYGEPGTFAVITVSDNGSGMDGKIRERIFEPFFTTKGVGKGTGLGLSIAYGIIKQHNGYINVYSETDKGTTFKIYLPLTDQQERTKSPGGIVETVSGTETILLVEDDHEIRATLKELLEIEGYTIIEAVDGEDGAAKFHEHQEEIHLLILDVVMPKKNGKALHDEIRTVSPDMKALFISGYTADLLHAKGVLQADVNFLSKPIIIQRLLLKIREILD